MLKFFAHRRLGVAERMGRAERFESRDLGRDNWGLFAASNCNGIRTF